MWHRPWNLNWKAAKTQNKVEHQAIAPTFIHSYQQTSIPVLRIYTAIFQSSTFLPIYELLIQHNLSYFSTIHRYLEDSEHHPRLRKAQFDSRLALFSRAKHVHLFITVGWTTSYMNSFLWRVLVNTASTQQNQQNLRGDVDFPRDDIAVIILATARPHIIVIRSLMKLKELKLKLVLQMGISI